MWLKQLSIQHFRNYQELEVEFHPGLNIFLDVYKRQVLHRSNLHWSDC